MPAPLVVFGVAITWELAATLLMMLFRMLWVLIRSAPRAVSELLKLIAGAGTITAVVDAMLGGAISEFWHGLAGFQAFCLNTFLKTDSFRAEELKGNYRQGVSAGVGREVAKNAGITLRDILDKEKTIEDLEDHALTQIKQRTGYELHSLRNVEAMKRDFARIAQGEIAERVGIPLSNILDPETTKREILDWAQDEVMMRISDDVSEAVAAQVQKGGATLLKTIQDKIGKRVSGKSLLLGVRDAMASRYMIRWEAFRELSKQDRRKLQNKIAQRRFRDRADPKSEIYDGRRGGKMEYVPLGWYAKIDPPNVQGYMSDISAKAKRKLAGIKDAITGAKTAEPPPSPTEAQVPPASDKPAPAKPSLPPMLPPAGDF